MVTEGWINTVATRTVDEMYVCVCVCVSLCVFGLQRSAQTRSGTETFTPKVCLVQLSFKGKKRAAEEEALCTQQTEQQRVSHSEEGKDTQQVTPGEITVPK